MKNSETGEFELVLGNRHLLSGFFIVVLLFGVAFAMGYIVGRNSAPSSRSQAADKTAAAASTAPGETRAPAEPAAQPPEAASEAQPTAAEPKAQPPADEPAQPTTQPAREGPAAPTAAAQAPAAPTEPAAGTYWQVMAVKQAEGEIVVRTLKDKGFPASLGPGPNNLVRVLVGPYPDTQSLGRAKSALENAGFHPILKK